MSRRKLAISCTDGAWERLQARAAGRGQSASQYAVERALSADPPPRAPVPDAEPLVLGAAEQRALHDRVARIEAGLGEGGPAAERLAQLERRVNVLLTMVAEEWVRAGHGERLLAIAQDVVGEERMPAMRAWIRRWEDDRRE